MNKNDTLAPAEQGEFEFALFSAEHNYNLISCFPESASPGAEYAVQTIARGGMLTQFYYPTRSSLPLTVICGDRRWMVVRSLFIYTGIGLVVNLNSPRWRDLGDRDIPMDVAYLSGAGDWETELYNGEEITSESDHRRQCAVHLLSGLAMSTGNSDVAAGCIIAVADVVGCGLELRWGKEYVEMRELDVGVATGVSLLMLTLCHRFGASRGGCMTIDRRDGEWQMNFDFDLYRELGDAAEDMLKRSNEYLTCRSLADKYNVFFDLAVSDGSVRVRFFPKRRDWSQLGIKLPTGLEYDQ